MSESLPLEERAAQNGRALAAQAPAEHPVAMQSDSDALMRTILEAAARPDVDVTKMQQLFELHGKVIARKAEQEFNAAMADAQSEMRHVAPDKHNKQTSSEYASYAALDKALRPIYSRHGFALSFDTGDAGENMVRVLCHVSHTGGFSRDYKIDMPADGKGAKGNDVMTRTHATGSALTYGRRYLLSAIFNIAIGLDDDDGNSASGNGPIDERQFETLQGLIAKYSVDIEKFTRYMNVDSLKDIRQSDYDRAVQAINLKASKAGAAA